MPVHNSDDLKVMCEKLEDVLTISTELWNEGLDTKGDRISRAAERNYEKIIKGPMMELSHLRKVNKESLKLIRRLTISPPQPPSPLATGGTIPAFYLDPTFAFVLPPLDEDKEFIPLLSATYEFGLTSYRLSFPVALIRFHDDDSFDFWGVGFRFESSWNGGNHNYFHVQPTPKPFERGRFARKLPVFCDWLPSTYPCIPTGARCPITLLYALLISMYGRKGFTKAFLSMWTDATYSQVLKQYWT